MYVLSVFNNKGGVGKTTLTFHLAHALSEMGHKTLLIDLDPQCNLTISSLSEEKIQGIWDEEEDFIRSFEIADKEKERFKEIARKNRSIHFLLRPLDNGKSIFEYDVIPKPCSLGKNLDLLPGRLSVNKYEDTIAEQLPFAFKPGGNYLSIKIIMEVRNICEEYSKKYGYHYIIVDTSPSLGILNKVIISTVDGFFIPAQPDMFSLYGIKNIGRSLELWQQEFEKLRSENQLRLEKFPKYFVQFLGYTIYNAKKYDNKSKPNKPKLAQAHSYYVDKIPKFIKQYIKDANKKFNKEVIEKSIGDMGDNTIMYSHNTFPSLSQKYQVPMWKIPSCSHLEAEDVNTVRGGNKAKYEELQGKYHAFAKELIGRVQELSRSDGFGFVNNPCNLNE
ncbi:ParA family protein [Helicobacter cetorum]|uniref:ParA family protein n=1 Tax=Helicobacter cetorum TaxID=138563 RepID=UPI000CF080B6|nr:ParA family protein [Helicobacter cetorum]